MTSPDNHEATVRVLRRARAASASSTSGSSSRARCRPSTANRARSCWPSKGHVALSPDGHGGTLAALAAPGPAAAPSCLDEMRERGVRDALLLPGRQPAGQDRRPGLPRPAPPGRRRDVVQGDREARARREARAWSSSVDGRPQVIEYSDLPAELAERREPDGSLELWAGSIADPRPRAVVHRAAGRRAAPSLPFHRAIKKVALRRRRAARSSSRPSRTP